MNQTVMATQNNIDDDFAGGINNFQERSIQLQKKESIQQAKQKHTALKLGVPSLDFTQLKQVKEYKDWYGYSQKLENAIKLLREKVDGLENERKLYILK